MESRSRIVSRDNARASKSIAVYTLSLVRAQFLSEWDPPRASPAPCFKKAYEIMLPRDARIRHEQYR